MATKPDGEPLRLDAFFAQDGPLARGLDSFEPRAEQRSVAEKVASCLHKGGKLVAEAGTGTGKTLAYLVPALSSGLKVVVSTGTKSLQEQIVHKDLPLLARTLGRSFDVQVMKGRTNYLCQARANELAAKPTLPGIDVDRILLASILEWRETTPTGDRAELASLADDSPLWRELSVTSEQCTGRSCREYERCFVTRMRRRAQEAALVVVNHHLYFADAALRQSLGSEGVSLIAPHDAVVFDEAHELDEVAAQHFGFQVSERRVHELARDIARAVSEAPALVTALRSPLHELVLRSRRLFDLVPFGEGRKLLQAGEFGAKLAGAYGELDTVLERLAAELGGATIDDGAHLARRSDRLAAELAMLLELAARKPLSAEADSDLSSSVPYVRYSEGRGAGRALVARPIEVAPLVSRVLEPFAAVFISASLAVGGSFAHFRRRIGLYEADELLVGSPFDYEHNACLYLPEDLPLPDQPEFSDEAPKRAAALVAASRGGAFVLCTSHRMLPIMREAIARATELEVLVQGEAPKSHLVETFRRHGNAVLVATMSFWTGIDVPGEALRLVIIDKLPFASPADPLVAARLEYLRAHGEDPFTSYQLPQAALLLRQGFGRLIRRQSDRGLVAILDTRLHRRGYGRVLLSSLPPCRRTSDLGRAIAFLSSECAGPKAQASLRQ